MSSLAQEAETDETERRQWALGDTRVCFDAFCSMLGSTKRTIINMAKGEPDMRKKGTTQTSM